jgi:hypothetical protein
MAFSFGSAAEAVGGLAEGIQANRLEMARERRQQALDAQQAERERYRNAYDQALTEREKQTRIKVGDPVRLPNGSMKQTYWSATGGIQTQVTEPSDEDIAKEFKQVTGRDMTPEEQTARMMARLGVKAPAETADMRKREDYALYLRAHPDYKGSFEQWGVEQGQLGRQAVPTQRDDRFLDIERRKALGEQLTANDQAYAAAYDLYIKKRITDPALARAAAFGANRFVQVIDPQNPERVTFMTAGDASRSRAGSPASISYRTDAAMTRYMTSGMGGQNIAAFNTAINHLNLLGEAGEALDNGDVQRLNQLGNAFAREFGSAAPTNFAAVKTAVAGEIAKVFTGRGATVEEIAQINGVINAAESPQQIGGAIQYYISLMNGKLSALQTQYQAGRQGLPAFPGTGNRDQGAGNREQGAGANDGFIYARDPQGGLHRAKRGQTIPPGWQVTDAPSQ